MKAGDHISFSGGELRCTLCQVAVPLPSHPDPFAKLNSWLRMADDFAVFHPHPEQKKNAPAVSTSRGA